MNNFNNTLFMAFATGKESKDNGVFKQKLFKGLATLKFLGINPSKEELTAIFGKETDYMPKYFDEAEVEINGEKRTVPRARIVIYMSLDLGEDDRQIIPLNFFITKAPMFSRDGRIQFINQYGQTAYLFKEDIKNNTIPENMKWFLLDGIKPCMRGEEGLIDFMKKFININEPTEYNSETKSWSLIKDLSTAVATIEDPVMEQLFRGDASVLSAAFRMQPDNEIKVMLGVREHEGKEYQAFYSRKFLRAGATNYDKFFDSIKENAEYDNTKYLFDKVEEVVHSETNMEEVIDTSDDLPFSTDDSNSDWY